MSYLNHYGITVILLFLVSLGFVATLVVFIAAINAAFNISSYKDTEE